jgi:virulence factor Mce-like protein
MAVVVAPTVVADRYLQLAPVYTGGPTLAAGSVIPRERTASPAEFDDLLASAQKLSTSLGPQGVNSTGALSDALHSFALNLNGNGQQINTTLDNTAQAITTLSASRDNLAGTVRNLQSFTTNLKQDDGKVRDFTRQFAQVNDYLAGERENLGKTLEELSETLSDVAKFVHDNRDGIRSNVDKLGDILGTINAERLSLEQGLDTAPLGLDGLVNAYNASSGTLDTRPDLLGSLLCSLYNQLILLPAPVGDGLKGILGPPLLAFLSANASGCVNLPTGVSQLPGQALSTLSGPNQPMMFGERGSAPASGGLLGPVTGQSPARSSDSDDEGSSDNSGPAKPGGPPSLGTLLGGGR